MVRKSRLIGAIVILVCVGGLIAMSALVLQLWAERVIPVVPGRQLRSRVYRPPPDPSRTELSLRSINHWMPADFFDTCEGIEACEAISAGNHERLRELIDRGLDVNLSGTAGMTPLLWAYVDRNLEAFELLLESGADPDKKLTDFVEHSGGWFCRGDSVPLTCIHNHWDHWKFVFAALPYSNNVNQRQPVLGGTLLHDCMWAGTIEYTTEESLKRLVAFGVELDAQDRDGRTAAMLAIRGGRPLLCLCLLEAGADPSIRDNQGLAITDTLSRAIHGYEVRQDVSGLSKVVRLRDWLEAHGEESCGADKAESP